MGRLLELLPTVPSLDRSEERDSKLSGDLAWEIENALSARAPQEAEWREATRQYAALPRKPYRHTPIPDAPNIEIPLGAQHADDLYAQMIDTLYAGDPLLTTRAMSSEWDDHSKAMQRWTNYMAAHEVRLRDATDHAFANCIQYGTSAYYIPFTEEVMQTKTHRVVDRGPRIIPIAPENLLFIGGSRGDIEADRWVALRFWYTPGQLREQCRRLGWSFDQAMPVAMTDWVRQTRETYALTTGSGNFYEYYEIYRVAIRYDYHGDGVELDLEAIFDRSSAKILHVTYYPYDTRAIVPMRYQLRPDAAYGLGVMAMLRSHQEESTEVHNYRLLNMFLANTRMWSAVEGSVPETMEVYPNKIVPVREKGALQEHRLSDIYPSSGEAEREINTLAEKRVGTTGGPSSSGSPFMGTRTPGITALSRMQTQNRRFTPPFDQMRLATAEALRQAILRTRERILMKDKKVMDHLEAVLGPDDAQRVIDLLKQPDFRQAVAVEFTAASPQTNREADRVAMTQLWNAMMTTYYQPAMQLLAQVANPQSPPELRDMAKQVIERANELADRYLRTYEQIPDPRPLLLDTSDALKDPDPGQQQNQQAMQVLQMLTGGQAAQPVGPDNTSLAG